jgi:hypothetical protein
LHSPTLYVRMFCMRIGAFEIADDAPTLTNTRALVMLRPWVDVGRVGTLVLRKIESHLGAREVGKLARPGNFFDFTMYRPRAQANDGQRSLSIPNSEIHYAHDDATDRDHLFLHLREPHARGEDFTDAIVEVFQYFNVTEYCRVGSMYDSVPHTRPLRVTGSLTEDQELRSQGIVSIHQNTYQGPTSIVNLVNQSLDDMGVESTSLMLHLPHYVQLDEDYMGVARMMEAMCALYGYPESLIDTEKGEIQYREISQGVKNNPGVAKLLEHMEREYDLQQPTSDPEQVEEGDTLLMPTEMEDFLRELEGRPRDPEE